jgi:uncharacterized membrane protein YvlD (DUF360 family)
MQGLLLRWLILTVAIMIAAYLFSGIHVTEFAEFSGEQLFRRRRRQIAHV